MTSDNQAFSTGRSDGFFQESGDKPEANIMIIESASGFMLITVP